MFVSSWIVNKILLMLGYLCTQIWAPNHWVIMLLFWRTKWLFSEDCVHVEMSVFSSSNSTTRSVCSGHLSETFLHGVTANHLYLSFFTMQSCKSYLDVCWMSVCFRLFRELATQNWKSLDIRVSVNNFVKTHTPDCINKPIGTQFLLFYLS